MKGITKKKVNDWLRFKLCRWTYCGYERHYFSAVDTDTAIAYAEHRTHHWDNAELIPVHPEQQGVYYRPIWGKGGSKIIIVHSAAASSNVQKNENILRYLYT